MTETSPLYITSDPEQCHSELKRFKVWKIRRFQLTDFQSKRPEKIQHVEETSDFHGKLLQLIQDQISADQLFFTCSKSLWEND